MSRSRVAGAAIVTAAGLVLAAAGVAVASSGSGPADSGPQRLAAASAESVPATAVLGDSVLGDSVLGDSVPGDAPAEAGCDPAAVLIPGELSVPAGTRAGAPVESSLESGDLVLGEEAVELPEAGPGDTAECTAGDESAEPVESGTSSR
ncbi:hypothetical protein [Kineosporia succinea]|uniref:Small secreted domain DUF320 n=1 Tax=Kineosporia succinea TaxID=84632 RepID=A0ABT9P9D8_9ACTN|nr:hypothetical protein [Kineosporia succinea]MDP9829317.1 hypothetical protein [Kineosporia succinea]